MTQVYEPCILIKDHFPEELGDAMPTVVALKTHTVYSARQIARLVKLLDMDTAQALIEALLNFPDELRMDIQYIERVAAADHIQYINDLIDWYGYKALAVKTGLPSVLEPPHLMAKSDLMIFKLH